MKFKNIFSVLSSSILMFSVFGSEVYAENDIEISVDSVKAESDGNFQVNVNISGVSDAGICGLQFAVKYDSSLIDVTSVSQGSIITSTVSENNGDMADSPALSYFIKDSCVNILWLTENDSCFIKDDGVFVTISGTVNAGVSGMAELEIVPVALSDSFGSKVYVAVGQDAQLITPTVKNGYISIGSEPSQSDNNSSGTGADLLGDVNCDNIIDVRDVTMLKQYVVQLITLGEKEAENADIVSDGYIDVKDLGQLLKYTVHLIDKF